MTFGFWTYARQADLERFAARRLSASQIAARLGCGCTRNMVIGRAWRTDVALRGAAAGGSPSAAGRAAAEARRLNPIHLKRSAAA